MLKKPLIKNKIWEHLESLKQPITSELVFNELKNLYELLQKEELLPNITYSQFVQAAQFGYENPSTMYQGLAEMLRRKGFMS